MSDPVALYVSTAILAGLICGLPFLALWGLRWVARMLRARREAAEARTEIDWRSI